MFFREGAFPLETKKTTFFAKNVIGKCSVSCIFVFCTLRTITSGLRSPSLLLASWTRGYFRSECWTSGETMAALRVNCSLAPTHGRWARGWTGRKYRFSSFRYGQIWNRTPPTRFGGACSTSLLRKCGRGFIRNKLISVCSNQRSLLWIRLSNAQENLHISQTCFKWYLQLAASAVTQGCCCSKVHSVTTLQGGTWHARPQSYAAHSVIVTSRNAGSTVFTNALG